MDLENTRHLIQLLKEPMTDCLTSETIQAYVEAQIKGRDLATEFNRVRFHLDSCIECSEKYAEVYDEIEDVMLATIPPPQLVFLQRDSTIAESLLDALLQKGERLQIQFSEQLNALLRPVQLAALRSHERYGKQILQLSAEDMILLSSTLPLSLSAFEDSQNTERCLVEVKVRPPDKSWPLLAGYTITLAFGSTSKSQITDAHGEAVFADIAVEDLGQMQVVVTSPPPQD